MPSTSQKVNVKQNALMAVLAFFLPAVVLLACYIVAGLSPFGDISPMSELTEQWFADAKHLRELLISGSGSLFYSFENGFGADFYSSFASCLCSPSILIFTFFGEDEIFVAYMLILMFRAAFAGLFCYLMLSPMEQTQPVAALAVSVGYASGSILCLGLAAPGITDAAVLLPLVGAGVASLVDRGGVVLLYVAVTLFFACSTTLWPCCVLFSVIFFLWRTTMYQERGRWLAQFSLLLMCFALAAGSAAVVGIPVFSTGIELGTAVTAYENADVAGVFQAVSGMFVGGEAHGIAAVLCGSVLTVLMIPVYLFNSRFTAGERAVAMAGLVLSLAVLVTPASWLLTIFAAPTNSVAAAGVVYCALAAAMAARGFSRPAGIRVPIVVLGWTLAILCFVCALLLSGEKYTISATVFTFSFITLYAALVILAGSGKRMTTVFAALLALCVACECAFGLVNEVKASQKSLSLYDMQAIDEKNKSEESLLGIIDSSEYNLQTIDFYRVRGADGGGINNITSMSGKQSDVCAKLLNVLGVKDGVGYTPLTDALFSVKYSVGSEQNGYSTIGNVDGISVQRNDNILPLAYLSSEQVLDLTQYSENPFEAQNQLISAVSGAQRVIFNQAAIYSRAGNGTSMLDLNGETEITRYDDYGTIDYVVYAPVSGRMYMWYGCPYDEPETVFVNGTPVTMSSMNRIIPLGRFNSGDMVNISVTVSNSRFILGNVYFSSIDEVLLDAAIDQLVAKQVSFTQTEDGKIKLGAAVEAGQIIMTTIPYQVGWEIVDASGKSLDSECAAGAFLALAPGEGSAAVELIYKPNDFTLSFAASALFLLLSLTITVVIEYRRNAAGVSPRRQYGVEYEEEDDLLPMDYFPNMQPVEYAPADMVYPRRYVSAARSESQPEPQLMPLTEQIPEQVPIQPLPPLPTFTDLPHPPAPVDPSVFDRLVGPGAQYYSDPETKN